MMLVKIYYRAYQPGLKLFVLYIIQTPYCTMNLTEINQILGDISAELSLFEHDMGDVSEPLLRKLSSVLQDNLSDFELAMATLNKNSVTEFFVSEIYSSLTSYSIWYANNCDNDGPEQTKNSAKLVYTQIEILWRPVIEIAFPNFMPSSHEYSDKEKDRLSPEDSDNKEDPLGYNKKYRRGSERYRSIRYDLIENPEYPHLTPDVLYERLKQIISHFPHDGADISRLLSIAYKHGLLKCKPYIKSVIRELGMTCTEQSFTQFIGSPDETISYSKRLKWMEEELLKI